jgi:hypothetical protein
MDNEPPVDPNPPLSLAEIIQQRMASEASAALEQERTKTRYRQAGRNGAVVGVFASVILLILFLLKFGI